MKRFIKIILAPIIGIIAIIFIGLTLFLKPILEFTAAKAGFPEIKIGAASFGLSGTVITDISFKNTIIRDIRLYTTLADLRQKRLTKITMTGAEVNMADFLSDRPSQSTFAMNLFAREAVLKEITFNIFTPQGRLPVTLDCQIFDKGESYHATANYVSKATFAEAAGQAIVNINKSTGMLNLQTEISNADFRHEAVEFKRVAGWISADMSIPEIKTRLPDINAQLTAGSARIYGIPFQGATLSASGLEKKQSLVLSAAAAEGSGDITGDIVLDTSQKDADKLSAKLEANLKNLDALGLEGLNGRGNFSLLLQAEKDKSSSPDTIAAWKKISGGASVNAEKLSLRGLLRNTAAAGRLTASYDPEKKEIIAETDNTPVSFKGVIVPLGKEPVEVKSSGAKIVYNAVNKTLRSVFKDAKFQNDLLSANDVNSDITVYMQEAPVLEGKIAINTLSHAAKPAYIVPIKLEVSLNSLSSKQYTTGFSGTISDKAGLFTAGINGKYDSLNKKGDASLRMAPVTLRDGVHSFASIAPITANYLEASSGTVGMTLEAGFGFDKKGNWQLGTLGEILLKDVNAVYDGTTVQGINTLFVLDSLYPPVFKNQSVSVNAIDAGIALSNTVVEASIEENAPDILKINQLEGVFASGQIRTAAPFDLPLETLSTRLTLVAERLNLSEIFAISATEGLNAIGSVNGNLPVTIDKGRILIENGVLETVGTGTISYVPENVPAFLQDESNPAIVDLRTALTQFNYDSLRMTINGEAGKDQKIALQIKGKNPIFYNGKPVNFNLNLEGPLQNILKYNPGSSSIPDSIRKQMEAYENKNAP